MNDEENPLLRRRRQHDQASEEERKQGLKQELGCLGSVGCVWLLGTVGLGLLIWLLKLINGA